MARTMPSLLALALGVSLPLGLVVALAPTIRRGLDNARLENGSPSPHISYSDLRVTDTPFPNRPSTMQIRRLRRLAREVLEPAWRAIGPFTIVHGYQSPAVARSVKIVRSKLHKSGRAVCVKPLGIEPSKAVAVLRGMEFPRGVKFNTVPTPAGPCLQISWDG